VVPRAGLDAVEKRKSLAPTGNPTPSVQPLARRCTDWFELFFILCFNPFVAGKITYKTKTIFYFEVLREQKLL
jgi:hypothetical protein